MLDCGHPDECQEGDECRWCEEVRGLKLQGDAMSRRNRQLLECEKRRSITFAPGTHMMQGASIGLLLIEKGAVVTFDGAGQTLEWVDVNGGTFNAGPLPTKSWLREMGYPVMATLLLLGAKVV